MRRPLLKLHVHVVWATWDRRPVLVAPLRQEIHAAIAAKARELGCDRVTVGGVEDHVHVLLDLSATISIADLVQRLKGSSSHLFNRRVAWDEPFRWQGAYGAFSVSEPDVAVVRRYVLDQERHHGQADTRMDLEQTYDTTDNPKPREGEAS